MGASACRLSLMDPRLQQEAILEDSGRSVRFPVFKLCRPQISAEATFVTDEIITGQSEIIPREVQKMAN